MAILNDDILKRSIFNTYEIEIDNNIHIFVDLHSMARYSKLFYTILTECKEESDVPKMIGSLEHWKIVHNTCVGRKNGYEYGWSGSQGEILNDKINFFILLEYLIFTKDIRDIFIKCQEFTDNELLALPRDCCVSAIRNKIKPQRNSCLFIENFQKWTTVRHLVLDVLKDMFKDKVLDRPHFDVKILQMGSNSLGVYFYVPKGINFELFANELDKEFYKNENKYHY